MKQFWILVICLAIAIPVSGSQVALLFLLYKYHVPTSLAALLCVAVTLIVAYLLTRYRLVDKLAIYLEKK